MTLPVCVCVSECVYVHSLTTCMLFVCEEFRAAGWDVMAGGVVVDTASLLQCHLSLLSYLFLWQHTGHLIRP